MFEFHLSIWAVAGLTVGLLFLAIFLMAWLDKMGQ